jgi:argininosuccinate lyase
MWSGRFRGSANERADSFNGSLDVDKRMYKQDIMGSIAHCTMLGECGIITETAAELINKTLSDIFYDIKSGKLAVSGAEDIHMFVETELTGRIGDTGKKLHTARSRNDQVALDLRLYLRDSIDEIALLLRGFIDEIIKIAEDNLDTFMPAYTHMQKAQPTTLAHYYMAYAEMLLRDIYRFSDCRARVNFMPLGSCALTGTTYPVNRARVAELLEFADITPNSIDAVSDRDFAIEFLSACSILIMHLSRFSEEIIYWSSHEFGFITLSDEFSTGSSIMPQKKNPDISELIRGKTGRCYGNLISLLTVMKGLPLAYNKDMQEDKDAVFDSEITVKEVLSVFTAMLPKLEFNKEQMLEGASGGFTAATECADYLVKKGVPFRTAHSVISGLVRSCEENGLTLTDLALEDFKRFSDLFESDILQTVQIQNAVLNRKIPGAPSPKFVTAEIKKMKKTLEKLFDF